MINRHHGLLSVVVLASCVGYSSPSLLNAEIDSKDYQLGRQLYTQGVRSGGEQIRAVVQNDIQVEGDQLICETCHRRSGMGSTEGQQVVPAIAGHMLFKPLKLPTSKPPEPPILRPAYTKESLLRAIRDGIDANGEPLDPFMPRYEINDSDIEGLIAYLNTLSQAISPGVTEEDMHFATIILDSSPEEENRALLEVMENYFEQKNVETRHESKRAKNAPWHKEWLFKPYRKWRLHVWELKGSPETWPKQLEKYYNELPVFAVLNGLVPVGWEKVHEFCQSNALPCLFPTTLTPVESTESFYNLYLDKGVVQEAEAVASHLSSSWKGVGEVVQIVDSSDPLSKIAASRFISEMEKRGMTAKDFHFTELADALQKIDSVAAGEAIVIWADRSKTDPLLLNINQKQQQERPALFLSTRFYGSATESIPEQLRGNIRFVHSSEMPSQLNRLLLRSTGWFKSRRIYKRQAKEIQANAYFSLKVVGDAVKQIRGYFYRDYLIEKIEHMVDDLPYTSIYPRISLAPGQRFVSRGFYIATIDAQGGGLVKLTNWRVP